MNYKVLITSEAIDDIFNLVRYIHTELCNPNAAEKLYYNLDREIKSMGDFPLKFSDSGIKYRGYTIHKKVLGSYLLHYKPGKTGSLCSQGSERPDGLAGHIKPDKIISFYKLPK